MAKPLFRDRQSCGDVTSTRMRTDCACPTELRHLVKLALPASTLQFVSIVTLMLMCWATIPVRQALHVSSANLQEARRLNSPSGCQFLNSAWRHMRWVSSSLCSRVCAGAEQRGVSAARCALDVNHAVDCRYGVQVQDTHQTRHHG